MTPEFSRPERLDAMGEEARTVRIAADAKERAALAKRFDLIAVERLEAVFAVRREAAGVAVEGRVTGAVIQACSVSGEPLSAFIDEPVALRFVHAAAEGEEVELSADALDTLPIEGGAVDLGEAAAETLALAFDPFARGPEADEALATAKRLGGGEAGAFDALAALRDRLPG